MDQYGQGLIFDAYKAHYGLQRADRNRPAQAQSEERQREEKSSQRKAGVVAPFGEKMSELVFHRSRNVSCR